MTDQELIEKLRRLVVILGDRALRECDNVGGPPREVCHCDVCEGVRLLDEVERHESVTPSA